MDIELTIECLRCTAPFKLNLMDASHGRPVRCPFCLSSMLEIKGDACIKTPVGPNGPEPVVKGRPDARKIKP